MKEMETVKWIYEHTGKKIYRIILLTVLNIWSSVCVAGFAMLSKTVIDYAGTGDKHMLIKSSISLAVLIVSQMLVRIIFSTLEIVFRGKAEKDLKSFVFESVLRGDYATITSYHSGDIMTRLTADVETVSSSSISLVPLTVGYIARLISGAAALIILDKKFAFVFIVCGIGIGIVAAVLRKPIKSLHRNAQEKDAKVRSYMQEMTENLFAVKIFRIYDTVKNKSDKLQQKLYKAKVRKNIISILAFIGFSIVFAFGFLGAVSYGAIGIMKGTITFGTVAALIQLVNQIQAPISNITGAIPTFFTMTASAQRLAELSNDKSETHIHDEVTYDEFESINAQNVCFGYEDELVLENLNFEIKKGEFVGIVGPSGVGKSTIFKLITGLYKATKGDIFVKTNSNKIACVNARNLFSAVPQGNMLFSGTIKENLTILSHCVDDEKIKDALRCACADFVYDLQDGLDFMLLENGEGISEGQAQRIAIARALLSDSHIILMDEATSALDTYTEMKLINNLKNRDDLTILFITHKENVIKECDKVIRIGK